jgi:hypothetical protein
VTQELLQQALDALEHQASFVDGYYAPIPAADEAATAIRAHLAQPAPVPTFDLNCTCGAVWEVRGKDVELVHTAAPVPVPLTESRVMELAREAGGTIYTNRHYKDSPAVAFSQDALMRFAHGIAASPEKKP